MVQELATEINVRKSYFYRYKYLALLQRLSYQFAATHDHPAPIQLHTRRHP